MLVVPDNLDRNARNVRAIGDPADTGRMLMDYMRVRLGVETLEGLDVLDVGCGVRFSQAIINRQVPIGTYTGVEVSAEVVDFLKKNVTDPRLTYYHVDIRNQLYNPGGMRPGGNTPSVLGDALYDVACMFSVITHQNPQEALHTFDFLHRHVRPAGHLFFSAFIHEGGAEYQELTPEKPGLRSSYTLAHLTDILAQSGWRVCSVSEPRPNGLPIMHSLLCVKTGGRRRDAAP